MSIKDQELKKWKEIIEYIFEKIDRLEIKIEENSPKQIVVSFDEGW